MYFPRPIQGLLKFTPISQCTEAEFASFYLVVLLYVVTNVNPLDRKICFL